MSTIELRKKIINQLSRIEDISFLRAIKTLVDSKAHEEIYKLSEFQRERIREGREQLRSGKTISNEALQKEIVQWLGSK
jgi:predicted transcriptional regulator